MVQRGIGLSHDPTTVDEATIEESVRNLLDGGAFQTAAAEVRAEMAAQPSPAEIVRRMEASV